MRRLGVLGCILLGLVMPGRPVQAAGKKIKERVRVADSRAALQGSLENEPGCDADYAPEPGCFGTPEPGCNYAPGPSCHCVPEPGCNYASQPGCNYAPGPSCHCVPEPGCHCVPEPGCSYAPQASRKHAPRRGGRNYPPEPNCGCNYGAEPNCGLMSDFDPCVAMSGAWDAMVGVGDSCGCQPDCCGGQPNFCGGQPDSCGCECCRHSSGPWAMGELLFLRYHRADGVRVGIDDGEEAEFDFEYTPRITVGWVGPDGLGGRVRFWEFDHNADASPDLEPGSQVQVDTYIFDLEAFDTFCLNRQWDLELSAGVRYCEFLEQMVDADAAEIRLNSFTGLGGVASAELRRGLGDGVIWFRARSAILMDDKDIFNDNGPDQVRLLDVTVGMTELAFGYDLVVPLRGGAYAFAGVQAEWQNWYNFSSSFEDTTNTEDFGGPSDVGFGGYGFRAGIAR